MNDLICSSIYAFFVIYPVILKFNETDVYLVEIISGMKKTYFQRFGSYKQVTDSK